MKALVIIIVVIILAGGGYYYYQSQHTATPVTQTTTSNSSMKENTTMKASPTTSSTGAAMKADTNSAVKEFTVEGKNFSMTPNKLTVNKGDKVKITFKNSDGMHDFVLDQFNVKTKALNSGEEATVEFTADKAGSFQYYCSVGNHRAMGMFGTLTVK